MLNLKAKNDEIISMQISKQVFSNLPKRNLLYYYIIINVSEYLNVIKYN